MIVKRMNNKDERRRQFLDVAAMIVVVHGPESMTCAAIARRCHVSTSLVLKYFKNRERLLEELATDAKARRDVHLLGALRRAVA